MHVLQVNVSLDPVTGGGTAARTASLCRALSASGARTSVLTLDLGLTGEVMEGLDGVGTTALRCLGRRFSVPEPAVRRIRAVVNSADVVHLSNHWTLLNALAFQAARRSGTPHVVTPAGALRVFGRSGWMKRGYNLAVGNRIVQTAAGRIAITPDERQDFAAYGVAPQEVSVIPNGVWGDEFANPSDAAHAELSARLGDDPRPFILFVGRLNPIKGPDLLMTAFAAARRQIGDLRLVFAGPDEGMAADVQAQAHKTGLEHRVTFLGPVHGPLKVAAYHRAQLLVVPSRQEAMSLVALEAGASGTPVLLTDVCGFPEVERVGGGRVVPATSGGLAEGLRDLLGDPARLPDMGRRLQRLVRADYTWQRAAQSHLDLYRSLVLRTATQAPHH